MYTRNGVVGLEAKPPVNPIDPERQESLVGFQSRRRPGSLSQDLRRRRHGACAEGKRGSSAASVSSIRPIATCPWQPEEDAKRRDFLLHMNPPADLRHVELNARCALPGLFQGEDNNNPYQFLQRAGEVVILYDYNHTSRVIHLDGRPHLGKDIRLFMGDSIGHWEGNTLVVDTTNFNDRTSLFARNTVSDRCAAHSGAVHH